MMLKMIMKGEGVMIMKHKVHEGGAEDAMEQDPAESEERGRQNPRQRPLCEKCSTEGDSFWQEGRCQDQLQELWALKGIDTRRSQEGTTLFNINACTYI